MPDHSTYVIEEMERLRDAGGNTYVLELVNLLKTTSIDAPCEKTGITPLLWSIENDFLFSFCLTQSVNVNASGTGEYALSPIEFALKMNAIDKADKLAMWGAQRPPEVESHRQKQRLERIERLREIAEIEKRLNRECKESWFLHRIDELSQKFGVEAKRGRKRAGQLSFKNVKLKQLAKLNDESVDDWFSSLHTEHLSQGLTLFTCEPLGWKASLEVIATPTKVHREVIAISGLMSDQGEDTTGERIATADRLDKVHAENPFQMLSCGRRGIVLKFLQTPVAPGTLAKSLGEIAPKLHWDYENQHIAEHGKHDTTPVDTLPLIASDLITDPIVSLPWE